MRDPPSRRRGTDVTSQALVLAACCLTGFLSMGTAFGMGAVYLDIMDTFNTSRPLAALVQSLCIGVGFGAGLVTGPVLGQVGGAATLAVGGVLGCVGLIGSSLASSIYVVIVCFGGLTGMGVSCTYMAAQIVSGSSLAARRHLALPLVVTHAGIGATVFPALLRALVEAYAVRGMFLVVAGIFLHSVLFGMVVRTFAASTRPPGNGTEIEVGVEEMKTFGASKCIAESETEMEDIRNNTRSVREVESKESERKRKPRRASERGHAGKDEDSTALSQGELRGESAEGREGNATVHTGCRSASEGRDARKTEQVRFQTSSGRQQPETSEKQTRHRPGTSHRGPGDERFAQDSAAACDGGMTSRVTYDGGMTSRVTNEGGAAPEHALGKVQPAPEHALGKVQPAAEHALGKVQPEFSQSQSATGIMAGRGIHRGPRRSSVVTVSATSVRSGDRGVGEADSPRRVSSAKRLTKRRRSSMSQTFRPDLFRNPRYVLVAIFCYSPFFSFNFPSIFLTDIVKERGLSVEQGTQLLAVLFGCNVAGRLVVGLLQLVSKVSVVRVQGAVIGCSGLALFAFALLAYVDDGSVFAAYVLVCALSGLFVGTLVASGPLACMELVSARQYAPALGYQYFIGGLFACLTGPFFGWVKDETGSYNPASYVALAQGVVAAVVVLGVTVCRRQARAPPANGVIEREQGGEKGDNRVAGHDVQENGEVACVESQHVCTRL